MRIRTIKPEFWTHPVIVRLSDATKLLAIGLLNYADDEGYFYADPRMVRAALRPLDEDSVITHGSITELSRHGYIEVKKHPTHGPVGRIPHFKRHQVINRPNKSTISTLFSEAFTDDSLNDHGTLTEPSMEEGKGREGNKGMEGSEGGERGGASAPPPPLAQAAPAKSDLQLRAERLLNRRPQTPLGPKEKTAWDKARKSIEATNEEEWLLLEAFYAAPQGETYSRKALEQLFNNWNGEIDRARAWDAKHYDPGADPRARVPGMSPDDPLVQQRTSF